MKYKIIIITLILLVLFTSIATVFAEDIADNTTFTTSNNEIEAIPEENATDVLTSTEITITEDNYDTYFNKYTGEIKDSLDSNIDTIKIGNVSNKAFTIDRPLNIMSASPDCKIENGVIHLISGSSGSNITGLTINNTKGEIYQDGLFVCKLHGIWFSNSSDNIVSNNTIRIAGAEGCYAMPMGYSSRNKILYNDIVSTFTSCILMGLCDYNNISYNRLEIRTCKFGVASNVIYFNPFGHADYSGPAECIGTCISNNYIKNSCNDIWAFTINILGECNDTSVINNTVINGYYGIKVYDEWPGSIQAKNVLIKNNTVINSTTSIITSNRDTIVSDNKIMGSSMDIGIDISGGSHIERNSIVCNNEITYENLYCGILLYSQSNAFNNTINLARYGQAIGITGNNSIVKDNCIHVTGDNGVGIAGNNVTLSGNIIHTKANGVSLVSTASIKYKCQNNRIYDNKIYADKYAVYIEGYIYNTYVYDNYIESNKSDAFYINVYTTLTDNNLGDISDNTINGIIKNTETLIINDTNFYDYFDEDGYFNYNFKDNSHRIIFLTFLSNKNLYFTDEITLTSNKQANLLYNVTITLKEDAYDSTIKDFKFYNFNKESIVIDGVENVVVKDNEFTILTDEIFEARIISVIHGCAYCNITDNDIYINSKADYTYAISVSEPPTSIRKYLSKNFIISDNNILIKSSGVAEAMYFDCLVESNITHNNINIISDDSAYGITICDMNTNPHDFVIDSNKIIVNSKEMSYLIELYRVDDCQITNNYLKGTSNGVYGIGIYASSSTINGNEIIVLGKPLTDEPPADALGKGNSAVYITRQSQIPEFEKNIFDVDNCEVIINQNSNIKNRDSNSFVIGNYNYNFYFNREGKLILGIIKDNDAILFKNFTDDKEMYINVPVSIFPYTHFNTFSGNLILSNGSNKSVVSGFDFKNGKIILNRVSDITIIKNNFTDFAIEDHDGVNNSISNNSFKGTQKVILDNCLGDAISFNDFNNTCFESQLILIKKSNETGMFNNSFNINGSSFKVIVSDSSNSTHVLDNYLNISGNGEIFGYYAHNAFNDRIANNNVLVNSTSGDSSAVGYRNSHNNEIAYNRIISYSDEGTDYAIVVGGENNTVTNNYLISSNGFKRGDYAVKGQNNTVHDNLPVIVYVSLNGTEDGNGTFENPYPTITKAIEKCLSGAIIYILPGMYNETNMVIDKNITLTAINLEGSTYINALNDRLFDIKANGTLTVNALKIFNGFSVEGGSLFNNLGTLMINNSLIYNSSSYYDNSNPTFKKKSKYDSYTYSYDCSNLGVGGAILNRGELIINSSTIFDNFAHKGGAIADFGKTTIVNSLIYNNTGVHGGAIYTDSKQELTIENCEFKDNLAIQTLDYCSIKRMEYEGQNLANLRYRYFTECDTLTGMGGAIYSNTMIDINNSVFDGNMAKYGGAIAYDSNILTNQNYYHEALDYSGKGGQIKYSPTSILNIENSIFKNNEAKNTSCGNLSMLIDDKYGGNLYNMHAEGGAIFGALLEFNVYNTTFEHNIASSNGGALCVQSLNSTIEACEFSDNVAGEAGGALDLFGNAQIFNTEISNNSAKYGGALQYSSYTFYGRTQNNMDMFNVTVSGNRAITRGGAFIVSVANFAIKNSNIYDNSAPEGTTMAGSSDSKIDARGNWWGSTDGPDDSVWVQNNIRFRTWLGQKVDWASVLVSTDKENDNSGNNGNGAKSSTTSTVSTGSGVHTGSTLKPDNSYSSKNGAGGFKFTGNWPSGNGRGTYGGTGTLDGANPYHSPGSSPTNVIGNAENPNSLSKTNSSSVNDLASVGMTANAADSSAGGQASSSEGAGGDSTKAYEITKEIEDIDEDIESPIFWLLFIMFCAMFFLGFYRKYNSEE